MLNRDNLKKSTAAIVAIISVLIGAGATYILYETSTDAELKLAHVNYENSYDLLNNNKTESLRLMPITTLYNTKRSDYPAKLFPAKNQIIDNQNHEIIAESVSGLDKAMILPGEAADICSIIYMTLNKTGNYTLQTTVYYLDVKTGEIETIEFYMDFCVYPNNKYDKDEYSYEMRPAKHDTFNKQWTVGKKYPFLN